VPISHPLRKAVPRKCVEQAGLFHISGRFLYNRQECETSCQRPSWSPGHAPQFADPIPAGKATNSRIRQQDTTAARDLLRRHVQKMAKRRPNPPHTGNSTIPMPHVFGSLNQYLFRTMGFRVFLALASGHRRGSESWAFAVLPIWISITGFPPTRTLAPEGQDEKVIKREYNVCFHIHVYGDWPRIIFRV
jgi:hypothetical protein